MAERIQTQVRLTSEELAELDRVGEEELQRSPAYLGVQVTRSMVMRLALGRGVAALREEIEAAKPKPKKRRK